MTQSRTCAALNFALCFALAFCCGAATAQEQDEFATAFAKVKGGAVYDSKEGVDGASVSETYLLTHLTCSAGSNKVRVLLPVGEDEGGRDLDSGADQETTLKKGPAGWRVTLKAFGKAQDVPVVFKPVKDKASLYARQPEVTMAVGSTLWKALVHPDGNKLLVMNGGLGTPVGVTRDGNFKRFLATCGIKDQLAAD